LNTPSEPKSTALTDAQLQALQSLEGSTIEYPKMSWREFFQFSIIRGNGHTSIWIGPVLITLDWWGHEHRGYPLISFNWRPD